MSAYALLDQADEDVLHKSRLLNVEEKPFKRVTKRLLTPNSPISTPPVLPPTPPPNGSAADEAAATYEAVRQKQLEEHRQWREDMLLDFAAFESSIARIQFLRTSNEKERQRYAVEKLKIEATALAVKQNTAELHVALGEAQKTLALRKTYDELAEKITSNRLLRPREDQNANLRKLNAEIVALQQESRDYAQTWSVRREQFGRIVEEGLQLRRLIRDEKEEVERREGMEEGEDGEEGEVSAQKESSSNTGTPRPDAGRATPMQVGHNGGGSTPSGLSIDKQQTPLDASPAARQQSPEYGEDATMTEQGEILQEDEAHTGGIGAGSIAAPAKGLVSELKEEGEEDESGFAQAGNGDKMDTT
ncbi:MAG: hypothetical protein M1827_004879 [Pycnora praestabilis]|nr:MAG: hypothetical protein M1827_004879 [Pycnora praestabilis]